MSLGRRREAFVRAFPDIPAAWPILSPDGRWLTATWIGGQNYRNASKLYGAYPPYYIPRVRALFPDVAPDRLLHACSGALGPEVEGTRLDVRVDPIDGVLPDVRGSVYAPPFGPGAFDLVLVDPPYEDLDALRYGTAPVNRARAMRGLATVVAAHGSVVWLDTQFPMFSKREWHWYGVITVIRSTNHRVRAAFLLRKI